MQWRPALSVANVGVDAEAQEQANDVRVVGTASPVERGAATVTGLRISSLGQQVSSLSKVSCLACAE